MNIKIRNGNRWVELTPCQSEILEIHLHGQLQSAYESKNWTYRQLDLVLRKLQRANSQSSQARKSDRI